MTAMSEGGVDRAAEAVRLYGLPLDEFIAERDAHAKRLRADDRERRGGAIKKLRKPSAAAAAINHAVRADPDAAAKLLETGEASRPPRRRRSPVRLATCARRSPSTATRSSA